MNIRFSLFGVEIWSIEIQRPEQTFVFQVDPPYDEDEDVEDDPALCWSSEYAMDLDSTGPPEDFGTRTVFDPTTQ